MTMQIDEQLTRLGHYLRVAGLTSLVLAEPANLAWLLGARSHVSLIGAPCFMAVVSGDPDRLHLEIITTENEVERLRQVEFADLDMSDRVSYHTVSWTKPLPSAAPTGAMVASDSPFPGTVDAAADMLGLRRILTSDQQARLKALTQTVARTVETVAAGVKRGELESEVAGRTAEALWERGLEPIVLLVGSGDALFTHRHPLPRKVPIKDRCMISVGARQRGLFTSVTRYATFGEPDPRLADAFARLLQVEAAFLDASRPGNQLSDALAAGRCAYADQGFGADAWLNHHQGGLGGFAARELIAGRDHDVELASGMVVAWNPTACGWKAEDVAIVDESGCQVQTPPGVDWPLVQVAGRVRAGYLVL